MRLKFVWFRLTEFESYWWQNALHMHLVDLSCIGPTFHHLAYKNLSAAAVLKTLKTEIDQRATTAPFQSLGRELQATGSELCEE